MLQQVNVVTGYMSELQASGDGGYNSPGAGSLWGRRMTAGAAENS